MSDPEMIPGTAEYNLTGAAMPAMMICNERGRGRECGGHARVETPAEAAEWLIEHAARFHAGVMIRFECWSRRPDALDALLHPTDAPALEAWAVGPYQPEDAPGVVDLTRYRTSKKAGHDV